MNRILIALLFLLLMACSTSKPVNKNTSNNALESLAKQRYGERYAVKQNESGTHSIVLQKYKSFEELFANIHFFIFENSTQSIILEDTLLRGSVKWHSDIEVITVSITTQSEGEVRHSKTIYYYDVVKKQKRERIY